MGTMDYIVNGIEMERNIVLAVTKAPNEPSRLELVCKPAPSQTQVTARINQASSFRAEPEPQLDQAGSRANEPARKLDLFNFDNQTINL
jgi:hypothetical protein